MGVDIRRAFDFRAGGPESRCMAHSVRGHLRLEIDEYDSAIRRFIPGYDTMIATAAEAVSGASAAIAAKATAATTATTAVTAATAAPVDRSDRIVDLGAGTGALAEAILERDPVGTVELLDIDSEMMGKARTRLARFGTRPLFSLRSYDEPFGPGRAFAASLSLHHIPTIAEKAALFERVFRALEAGGVFVNADVTMPTEPSTRRSMYRLWADHMVSQGISEAQAWEHFAAWAEEDTYLPLEEELHALRVVGFQAERMWNEGPIGVVVARKA
jgi:tRNA (cmo5U34)-methyltransferase